MYCLSVQICFLSAIIAFLTFAFAVVIVSEFLALIRVISLISRKKIVVPMTFVYLSVCLCSLVSTITKFAYLVNSVQQTRLASNGRLADVSLWVGFYSLCWCPYCLSGRSCLSALSFPRHIPETREGISFILHTHSHHLNMYVLFALYS